MRFTHFQTPEIAVNSFVSKDITFELCENEKPPSGDERFYQTDESNLNRREREGEFCERENCFRCCMNLYLQYILIARCENMKISVTQNWKVFKQFWGDKNSFKIHPTNFMSFSALKLDQRMLSLDPTAAANIKRWAFNLLWRYFDHKKRKPS